MSYASQRYLFDGMPHPSVEAVMGLLSPDLESFRLAISMPWDDLQIRRQEDNDPYFTDLSAGAFAIWLTTQAHRHAEDLLNQERIEIRKAYGKPYYVVQDQLILSIKKLTRRTNRYGISGLYRSNYGTDRSRDFWNHQSVDDAPNLPRFVLGYEFVQEITDIKIYVGWSKSHKQSFEWIEEIHAPVAVPSIAAIDDDTNERKEFKITAAKDSATGGDGA